METGAGTEDGLVHLCMVGNGDCYSIVLSVARRTNQLQLAVCMQMTFIDAKPRPVTCLTCIGWGSEYPWPPLR